MLASILILILFMPAAFLPAAINTFFTPGELNKMGICLENPQTMQGNNDTAHVPDENQCHCDQAMLKIPFVCV